MVATEGVPADVRQRGQIALGLVLGEISGADIAARFRRLHLRCRENPMRPQGQLSAMILAHAAMLRIADCRADPMSVADIDQGRLVVGIDRERCGPGGGQRGLALPSPG